MQDIISTSLVVSQSTFQHLFLVYMFIFLGAKAPLGSLEQKVKVKVKEKNLRSSMILPELLDDFCMQSMQIQVSNYAILH